MQRDTGWRNRGRASRGELVLADIKDSDLGAPFQIFLDSRYKLNTDETYENPCIFQIPTQHVMRYQAFRMRLKGLTIPVSWYVCDIYTNTLILRYDGAEYTVTITPGNYTVNSWPTVFETAVEAATGVNNAITCSLNTYTNKWTFTGAASFRFMSISEGTTMFAFLGFPTYPPESTTTYDAIAPNLTMSSELPVDFSGTNSIYVQTSLSCGNVEAYNESRATGGTSSFIGRVPVPVEYTGILNADPQGYQEAQLVERELSYIIITLLDENYNLLPCTLPWQMNLDVFSVKDPRNSMSVIPSKRMRMTAPEEAQEKTITEQPEYDDTYEEMAPEQVETQEVPMEEEEQLQLPPPEPVDQRMQWQREALQKFERHMLPETRVEKDSLTNTAWNNFSMSTIDPFHARGTLGELLGAPDANITFGTAYTGEGVQNPPPSIGYGGSTAQESGAQNP